MFLRGVLATALVGIGIIVSTGMALQVDSPPVVTGTGATANDSDTLALAPLSLGNPAAAATLAVQRPDVPLTTTPEPPEPWSRTIRVDRGETLSGILTDVGVARTDAQAAIAALRGHFDPRRIKPGQAITVTFVPETDDPTRGRTPAPGRFLGFAVAVDYAREVAVRRGGDGFTASEVEKPLVRTLAHHRGDIRDSLFVAGKRAGLGVPVLVRLIRAFSWDVDFQRDIRRGDAFEVVHERFRDETGETVHEGDILYAALTLSGRRHVLYRHTTEDGTTDYFDDKGRSVRKALLRTPIDGARLSSRYGRRKHPILGYTRMHRGVDFAAPTGTPIYAAGAGTVDYKGRKGGYGRYIRIRHNAEYSTAYAHLSRYARGLGKGKRVKQGEVIGYVGSSGRSTGPHLHYEILRQGRQTNPMKVKMPSGRRLAGAELERFQRARADVDRRVAVLVGSDELAAADD